MLLITTAAYPLGGVAVWAHSLLQGLSAVGWECRLALTVGDHCDPGPYLARHPWPNNLFVANATGTREGRIRALNAAIQRERPDCVIVVNTPDSFPAAARMGSQRPRIVLALHGIEPQFYSDLVDFKSVIDAVAAPSNLACELVRRLAEYPNECTFRIPAGVRTGEVSLKPPTEPLEIVYAGRLERDAKRTQDIPPITRRLDQRGFDYRLLIAGEGKERAALESELDGVHGEVQFLGALSTARLFADVYKPGRVLLITSERETGPLVAWEAMSRGMTVVTSCYRGLKADRLLQHENNALLFPVGDHEAAATELMRASDAVRYIKLAESGLDLVRSQFSHEAMVLRWDELLDNLRTAGQPGISELQFDPPADGRLASWLGIQTAENVRRALGRRFRHRSAGGEWPHSYGNADRTQAYEDLVARIDRWPDGHAPREPGEAPYSP